MANLYTYPYTYPYYSTQPYYNDSYPCEYGYYSDGYDSDEYDAYGPRPSRGVTLGERQGFLHRVAEQEDIELAHRSGGCHEGGRCEEYQYQIFSRGRRDMGPRAQGLTNREIFRILFDRPAGPRRGGMEGQEGEVRAPRRHVTRDMPGGGRDGQPRRRRAVEDSDSEDEMPRAGPSMGRRPARGPSTFAGRMGEHGPAMEEAELDAVEEPGNRGMSGSRGGMNRGGLGVRGGRGGRGSGAARGGMGRMGGMGDMDGMDSPSSGLGRRRGLGDCGLGGSRGGVTSSPDGMAGSRGGMAGSRGGMAGSRGEMAGSRGGMAGSRDRMAGSRAETGRRG
ncbi:MAG: hypothetical protein Q9182_000598 [Xanthomendoza sp. 2 TL-2023]